MAAIIILNSEIDVVQLVEVSDEHIVCAQLITCVGEIFVVSLYCQFSDEISPYIRKMERVIGKLQGKSIIICADVNAKSSLWYSGTSDERGELIEDFIQANDIIVINQPNNSPTFCSASGQSNIDVTLASPNVADRIINWKVEEKLTISDHNAITFRVRKVDQYQPRVVNSFPGFAMKNANWEALAASIKEVFNKNMKKYIIQADPESAERLVRENLRLCCHRVLRKRKKPTNSIPWWTDELAQKRQEVMKRRKKVNRCRKLGMNLSLQRTMDLYKRSKNDYNRLIKETKQRSWENFVTKIGNEDPWSIVYKIVTNKVKTADILYSVGAGDDATYDYETTVRRLLHKIVPNDNKEMETELHVEIVNYNNKYINYNMEPLITAEEVADAVRKTKNGKASGLDDISPEIVKTLWRAKPEILLDLYNNCFLAEKYPISWKRAKLKIILKNPDKDPTDIGSYRPIALLSVVGKVYERILLKRIQDYYSQFEGPAKRQYGFTQGYSTEDALVEATNAISTASAKYLIGIFIDITGAFDNLWWEAIKYRLAKIACPGRLFNIIKDYFNNREMIVSSKYSKICKDMEKGCPQGSIIGPIAWNWVMDVLLKQLEKEECNGISTFAYADDLLILISGNSRRELEEKATRIDKIQRDWCKMHKLEISSGKTSAMLLKGTLDSERLPVIRLNDVKIKYVKKLKYLGILLDEKLNFIEHVKDRKEKIKSVAAKINRIAREKWGLKRHTLDILYKVVYVPMITYGAAAWYKSVRLSHVKRQVDSLQRFLIISVRRVCKTVSTTAMQIVAGKCPLDLEIIKRGISYYIRKNKFVKWENYTYIPSEDSTKSLIKKENVVLEVKINEEWQRRWTLAEKGTITKKFLPIVDKETKESWFNPNMELLFILTGHGSINKKLVELGIEKTSRCPGCTYDETVEHILFECQKYCEIRYDSLCDGENWNHLIANKTEFQKLQVFVGKAYEIRRENMNNAG